MSYIITSDNMHAFNIEKEKHIPYKHAFADQSEHNKMSWNKDLGMKKY